jgi:hypothetical protein
MTEGSKLRVALVDGRNMVGYGTDDDPDNGVFLTPEDARTGTERIYVLRAGIRGITRT